MRQSIQPTYDSRATGPAYHVTYRVGGRTVTSREPIADPFLHGRVTLGWRALLVGLVRGRLTIEVVIGGHEDRLADVLELDANTLLPDSTRRAEFAARLRASVEREEP